MAEQDFTARILIVDDEPANLKLLDRMLRPQGYSNLLLVQDSREVLTQYAQQRPDLILLDINMPYLDGYEVMAQLKALQDPLLPPIVILTAQHTRDHLLRALAEGARDFIPKPFDRTELLMRVRNLLDAHLAHRMLYNQREVLEEMVRERTEELRRTRLQVVQRLGRAVEYRDNETGFHIMRVSEIAALLAESLGWDVEQRELMLHASPMHDIGKIGIPDKVLLKHGTFGAEERTIMNRHAEIGAEILKDGDTDLLQMAATIALSHHEKWDGSGYPHGLAGEAIPQAARIVAVSDVFDALTASRPYKKGWHVEDAIKFIRDNAGTHFDPEVVAHFMERLPEILAIRARYAEPEQDVGHV